MINGIQLKICGLTSAADAGAAAGIGADFLGFILYPKSSRFLSLDAYSRLRADLPDLRRVAVMVRPTPGELRVVSDSGFDFFQLHVDPETDQALAESWGEVAGVDRLWLVPHLPPDHPFPDWLLSLADTFLIDTFRQDAFGGTGATGDWGRFHDLSTEHPGKQWILAGGLNPENIAAAIRQSGARFVDLSSGVELSPGIKDPAKLKSLATAMGGSG
ncbi:MAG: phosphoribosylanthranilate isomerase [Opitutaceae bacterium]